MVLFAAFFRVFLHVKILLKVGSLQNASFNRVFLDFQVFAYQFFLDFRVWGLPRASFLAIL